MLELLVISFSATSLKPHNRVFQFGGTDILFSKWHVTAWGMYVRVLTKVILIFKATVLFLCTIFVMNREISKF